jgi:NhaP-type Na+/H+ or K+/H+ antiporter
VILVLVFGIALLVAVLLSGVAARSVLSTSLLFLVAGAVVGDGVLGWIYITPDSPVVAGAADLALFAVLFTDGAKLRRLGGEGSWQGPLRALGVGMPLTFVFVALLAHYLAGLDWLPALLAGAVLAPTDPVFASAIVSRADVPGRLRRLLSIESGLNDGLALPVVLLLLASTGYVSPDEPTSVPAVLLELGGGVVLGIAAPLVAWALFRIPGLGVTPQLQPLGPAALAATIYGLADVLGTNAYLAAFLGGALLGVLAPTAHEAFEPLGDQLSELAKFAALLVFGAVLTPMLFASASAGVWAVAVLALVLARPAAVAVALLGRTIDRTELFTAAWFGPKGFASVVYGLLVLHSGTPEAEQVYSLVAVTIALSIVVHSSTDIPVARLFRSRDDQGTTPRQAEERAGARPELGS